MKATTLRTTMRTTLRASLRASLRTTLRAPLRTTLRAAAMAAVFGTLATIVALQPARAQDAAASAAQAVRDAMQPLRMKAEVVAIDAGNRALALKGPAGNVMNVLVGQQAEGFDQLKVGDRVDVLYRSPLLVKAEKADERTRARDSKQADSPASGGFVAGRQTDVRATVVKIDRQKRLVTLRDAHRTQTLEAAPDVDLRNIEAGDTIRAVFASAAAVEIAPAAP